MIRVLNSSSIAAGCYALVGGILTLFAWALDLPRLADWNGDGIIMQPNTALLVAAAGIALLPVSSKVRFAAGLFMIALGGAIVFEHATDISLGIDQLLLFGRAWGSKATVVPGRIGVPASISCALAGIAFVLLARNEKAPIAVPVVGLLICCISGLSILGYLLGVDPLYSLPRFTAIAFQTATILLSIGMGLLAMCPDFQPIRILTEDSSGGELARRALPVVIIFPAFLGFLCLQGYLTGLYDAPMAVALLVLSLIIALCAVLWRGAAAIAAREESLQRSEERFSRFMEQLPGLAWIKDQEGRYQYVNEAAEKIFGVKREFLRGKTDRDLFSPETAAQFQKNDSEAISHGKGVQIVETLKHEDGVVHHSIVSKFPIANSKGEATLVGGIAIDITDRKRAEETVTALLRISKQLNSTLSIDGLLEILVQEAIDLVGAEAGVSGLLTPRGMVCSKYFKQGEVLPLEYCWPPMHGLPSWLIVHQVPYVTNDAKADPQIVQQLCQEFGVWSAISTPIISAKDGVIGFFEIHNKRDGSDFNQADQDLLLAVSQIAAIAVQNALAYRAIEDAEKSLKQSDRQKDEFLAVLAHELRNPLAPLRNGLEILKRASGNRELQKDAMSAMDRQMTHMVRLVDDLLDLSRISHSKLELCKQRVDLASVVQQAIETTLPAARRENQRIEIVLPAEPIYLEVDPVRLAQVLGNLLNNACKFSLPDAEVVVTAVCEANEAVITVKDHGQGIAPEYLERIFEMFAQIHSALDRLHGGLGIGLALARRLIQMHGGTITAHSDGPGRGSTFTIRLPVVNQSTADIKPVALNSGSRGVGPHKVLVVDDNRDAARTLAVLMEINGYEVVMAHDGQEACEVAEISRPATILLDIGLPKMNGHEACRAIRRTPWGKDMTIIALTGWGKDEDRRLSREAGFDGHLVKPVNYEDLVGMLTETA